MKKFALLAGIFLLNGFAAQAADAPQKHATNLKCHYGVLNPDQIKTIKMQMIANSKAGIQACPHVPAKH